MNDNLRLYRCVFLKENNEFIIGKDIFNEKVYHIRKSEETEGFKIGTDNSFYAERELKGILFKKNILKVINYNKVIEMA